MLSKIIKTELNKRYNLELIRTSRCCICCSMLTGISWIAFYVKLRAFILILLSFVPPLLRIIFEKSLRYPDGRTVIKPYLENQKLMLLYMVNILMGALIQCYGIASYYTWSVSENRLLNLNRIEKESFERLPIVHFSFFVHLLIFLAI